MMENAVSAGNGYITKCYVNVKLRETLPVTCCRSSGNRPVTAVYFIYLYDIAVVHAPLSFGNSFKIRVGGIDSSNADWGREQAHPSSGGDYVAKIRYPAKGVLVISNSICT